MKKEQLKEKFRRFILEFTNDVEKQINEIPNELIRVQSDVKWVEGLEKEVMKLQAENKELKKKLKLMNNSSYMKVKK